MQYVSHKIVTVIPVRGPVRTVNPIISSQITKDFPVGDIRKCILARATIYETLPNGQKIMIGFNNYNTLNYERKIEKVPVEEIPLTDPVKEKYATEVIAKVADEIFEVEENLPIEVHNVVEDQAAVEVEEIVSDEYSSDDMIGM